MGWKPNHKRIKVTVGRYPAYLEWLRTQPCYLCDRGGCSGDVVPAHTPDKATNGIGKKVDDRHAIPMCFNHHHEQHQVGWETFAERYGFSPKLVSAQYFSEWQYG